MNESTALKKRGGEATDIEVKTKDDMAVDLGIDGT